MSTYINTKTKAIITTECEIAGENWELFEEVKDEDCEEVKDEDCEEVKDEDYEQMTKDELISVCEEKGITVDSKMKKAEIIGLLNG